MAAGTHAGFVLAQQEVSFCMQLQQLRGRPEMAWLPPGTSERFLARGRSAVARAAECVMALKLWLQPHKLAREKAALRTMQSELEHAARAAPAPRKPWWPGVLEGNAPGHAAWLGALGALAPSLS